MRYKTVLVIVIVILFLGFGGVYSQWQRYMPHDSLASADAIVMLAGDYRERSPAVVKLFREGVAPRILLTNDGVFSSWSRKYGRNLYAVEFAEEQLVSLGIPRGNIVKLPFYGRSTMRDALAVKLYAQKHGLTKFVIVTSDYHLRRALWSFGRAFYGSNLSVSGCPAVSKAMYTTIYVVEPVKLVYYLCRYGLLGLLPETGALSSTESRAVNHDAYRVN